MAFVWSLQKLLDVTETRELAIKAELYELARRVAEGRAGIQRREDAIRDMIRDVREVDMVSRILGHDTLMNGLQYERDQIGRLREWVEEQIELRDEKKAELAMISARKENLRKLRQEAIRKHQRMVMLREQQQLDEAFQTNIARKRQNQVFALES